MTLAIGSLLACGGGVLFAVSVQKIRHGARATEFQLPIWLALMMIAGGVALQLRALAG